LTSLFKKNTHLMNAHEVWSFVNIMKFKRLRPKKSNSRDVSDYYKLHTDPESGISNILLNRLASLACGKENFVGVFASDCIPPSLAGRPRFIIIVNLAKRSTGFNGHFVTIIATPNCVQYIDPFGAKCVQPDVRTFLDNCGRVVRQNKRQYQDLNSVYCGFYCLLFALHADKKQAGTLPSRFKLDFFRDKKKLRDNDAKCVRYLREIIQYD
jgi:hypothetical protein